MLTRKQHELLMFIHNHLKSTGFSPSFDEMKDGLDLKSKSGVHRLITALEERGFLKRRAHRARALEVVRLPSDDFQSKERNAHENSNRGNKNFDIVEDFTSRSPFVRLPMVGRIAAGNPIEAIGEGESYLDVPSNLIALGEHYAVKISGDSMSEAGILDGDIAIIQVGISFDNGEIVVALIDDFEVTLKKIRKKGNSVALEPCNSMYETRIFGSHRVKVQGRLAGIMRTYSKYN
jgi:repressor LexA